MSAKWERAVSANGRMHPLTARRVRSSGFGSSADRRTLRIGVTTGLRPSNELVPAGSARS